MIVIGIGANVPSPKFGPPRRTCGAALAALETADLVIVRRSRWYESAPVPASDQPWFVNAVVGVKTARDPEHLMALLLQVEKAFGRERGERNAPRMLDLDLIAYGDAVIETETAAGPLRVPHRRMQERAFVLLPLRDVAPDWAHPETGDGITELIAGLPEDQQIRPMADGVGVHGTEWREPVAPATTTNDEET